MNTPDGPFLKFCAAMCLGLAAALGSALLLGLSAFAAPAREDDQDVLLSWRLIGNLPENRFQAELILTNDPARPLAGNWAIYFNCPSRLLPETVSDGFRLMHVNGDFYRLGPATGSRPVGPGERRSIRWEGAPWAINVSDAPSGFYLVRDDEPGGAQPVSIPLRIEPFPAADRLQRGAADAWPVVTAESRFHQNEGLELLASKDLIKTVPTPAETALRPGRVTLRSTTKIIYEAPLRSEAEFLAASLEPLLGARLVTVAATNASSDLPDTILLRVGDKVVVNGAPKRVGDEAYRLTVDKDTGVEILGTDSAGVFYGVQTLRTLLPLDAYRRPASELPIDATRIADAPRFSYRGLHLDVARNFQPKEEVEKLLDLMAFYKLNRFHWHLTDDEGWRIEIRALPELTDVGARRGHTLDEAECLIPSQGSGPLPDAAVSTGTGFYTQADVVEILHYARQRHIVVIPELDLPGHARAAVKAMEARYRRLMTQGQDAAANEFLLTDPVDRSQYESVQMWRDNVVDVGREATYRFLNLVVEELAAMYRRAGVELNTIHLGGDEVPDGTWEGSPACAMIAADADSSISRRGQLELHFLRRARDILARHGIRAACWEDCVLLALDRGAPATVDDLAGGRYPLLVYAWNNIWGWGREDAAYRMANAGLDVILCNATHLYFDLAYEKDPQERGYYWAGFVPTCAPFELTPLDALQSLHQDTMGRPVSADRKAQLTRLTTEGTGHVLGIQGQLWAENLRSPQRLEYMAFPRAVALAERAWACDPAWAHMDDPKLGREELARQWNEFANRLGQRELPRLDCLGGGVAYRIPPPGAVVRDRMLHANVAFPRMEIRYTEDGTEPTADSQLYRAPIPAARKIRLGTFDTRGRGSRTVVVESSPAAN